METKEKAPAATNSEEPQTKTSFTDQDSALIGVGQELDFGETLTPEHLAELRASVISDEVIAAAGIYSARTKDELPEDAQYLGKHGSGIYPVLVFPKKVASIGDSWQVKPQPGVIPPGDNGRSPKYISPGKGSASPCLSLVEHIAVTDDTDVVLIVEGTKQPLAVQSVLPEEWALYSFSGIHTWKTLHNGAYNPAFFGFSGHKVVIIPDADAATNPYVFDGATELGEYCVQVGAKEVAFVSVPGGGTTGMDDYLAHLPEDKRQGAVENLVKVATKKPAKRRPSGAAWGEARKGEAQKVARASGRTPLEVGKSVDKQELVEKIVDILVASQGGKTLFVQDTLVVKVVYRGASVSIKQLDVYDVVSVVLEEVLLFDILGGGVVCIDALSTKFAEVVLRRLTLRLPPLNGIRYVPVLLDDMTWLTHSGYHAETGLLLHLPPEFEGMCVPQNPTADDVAAAKDVLHDIFGEFAVRDEADYSRLLAGALTPFVRSAIDLAPMFVLTATGPGTGKGTAAKVFSILSTGKTIDVKLPANSAEELRKATFAQLLAGKSMIFLDELEYINDPSLNAVLTGESISDRKLGESRDITVTNASTFYAAGNNVIVGGDTIRRVCMVFFQWNDPAVRAYERKFKHTEYLDHVCQRRGTTVQALMTLVSAWAAAGQPVVPSFVAKPFATFTKWHRVLGGVLHHAGYADIMDGVDEFRESYDPGVLSNRSFIAWLHETFGTATFKAYDAYKSLKTAPDGEQYLPADVGLMNDLSSRLLGKALTKLADVNLGFELVLRRGAVKHNTNTYYVEVVSGCDPDDAPGGDDGGSGGGPGEPDVPVNPEPVEAAESGETVVVFDLETGDADDLHTSESADYIRLATCSVNGGEPVATTDIDGELIPLLMRADRIVGHNIVQFDLPALRRHYGLDSDALVEAGKVHDTYVLALLADPPPSGDERKKKKYNLNAVAQRLHVGGKLLTGGESVLKRLAAQYGGFDKIPVDNTDYVKYALQDVRATAAVYSRLLPMALDAVGADYMRREHLKMQRIATVAAHGVRIDTNVVEELLAEEERVRVDARQWFIDVVGVPDEGVKPWSSKLGKQALAAYIEAYGAVVPLTDKGDIATSKDAMAQLVADNPHSPELAELADKLLVVGQSNSPAANVQSNLRDGRVYPSIKPDQATGRLSTRDPALATFGSREERLLRHRSMVLPDEGEVLISVDLSQVDARCMAAGAGDKAYAALFAEGRDSHTEMAVRVFGDSGRRSDAKALSHATNYGMGAQGFAQYANISVGDAQHMLSLMRQEFPGLELFKKHLREEAKLNGYVTTAFGRRVPVDVEKHYTQAPAAFGQGTARDAFLEGVLALPTDIADMIRIFVHDEIVLSVPPERAEEIKHIVMDVFKSVQLPCANGVSVPVLADSAGPGENWSQCH